jgi:thiamine biosynthesis lipoprotein
MRFLIFVPVFLLFVSTVLPSERFEFEEVRMGVPVRVILYAESAETAKNAAQDVFERFNCLNGIMSDYDSDSELSQLSSQKATETTHVSDDLFAVLKLAKYFNMISDGAFDITVSPYVRLWRRSRRQKELPKQRYLDQAKELVGNGLWELDEQTHCVRFTKTGVRFDLGGIAKGYAIDNAFELVRKKYCIDSLLIDAGGDLRVGKKPPEKNNTEKNNWKINLDNKEMVLLENTAMATSGDRFQFVEIDGVRYSHLIDPKTGLGLTTSCTVHVIAPTAAEADALASAVSVLGPEKGVKLVETFKNISVKIILHNNNQVFQSKNW